MKVSMVLVHTSVSLKCVESSVQMHVSGSTMAVLFSKRALIGPKNRYGRYWGPKNHDSQRRDTILRKFLRPGFSPFSPEYQPVSLRNYTKSQEKEEKNIHWRDSKNTVETAGRNCRILPLVVGNVS